MSLTRRVLQILFIGVAVILATTRPVVAGAPPGAKQSIKGGGTTVDVTFLKEGGDAAIFQVALNTHSVNLDVYSFEEIVRLRDAQGSEVVPMVVEDVTGGGHHRRATVRFAWPRPRPTILELVVKGVAGVPERVFQWTVQ